MLSRKRGATLIIIPLVIVLVGMMIELASGDVLARGVAFLIASAVYRATLRYQEDTVRWEHGGLAVAMLLLGALYMYARF